MSEARKQAAERSRRYRQRQRLVGQPDATLLVEVPDYYDLLEKLLDDQRITAAQRQDRKAVAQAVWRIVTEWKKTVTRDARTPIGWGKLKP